MLKTQKHFDYIILFRKFAVLKGNKDIQHNKQY